jgi:maltose-binding protein MalE
MRRQMLWFSIALLFVIFSAGTALSEVQKDKTEKQQAVFAAMNPRGMPQAIKVLSLAPRLPDLNGKTVYVINTGKTYAEEIFAAVAKLLPEYYPQVKVVHTGKKKFYGEDEPELWKEVKEKAHAVIIGPMD